MSRSSVEDCVSKKLTTCPVAVAFARSRACRFVTLRSQYHSGRFALTEFELDLVGKRHALFSLRDPHQNCQFVDFFLIRLLPRVAATAAVCVRLPSECVCPPSGPGWNERPKLIIQVCGCV